MLKLFAASGTVAALAASTCCVMPLALGSLGLSGTVASGFDVLAPYQTVFRLAAVGLLAGGFWLVYAGRPVLAEGAACPTATAGAWSKPVLWAGALVLAIVLSEPVWGRWLA